MTRVKLPKHADQHRPPGTLGPSDPGGEDPIPPYPAGGGGTCAVWIYVGTPTQTAGQVDALGNSVPALIAANPSPYNVTPWVPFENGWNNSLGTDAPVAFSSDGCWLYLQGGFTGGSFNTTVFTLPTGFRPQFRTPLNCAFSDLSDIEDFYIDTDGSVVDLGGF